MTDSRIETLKALVESGATAREAATVLGVHFSTAWKIARRNGLQFAYTNGRDGNTEKAKAFAEAQRRRVLARMEEDDDPEWRPFRLSEAAIAKIYAGRRYDEITFRTKRA